MYTVYLVRDKNTKPPSYLSFVTNEDEQVISETAFTSEKYSEALLHASILFKLYYDLYGQEVIGSYLESSYNSIAITSYSEGEFRIKKVGDHFLYANLIDRYESLCTRLTPMQALKVIKRENQLTPDQRILLVHFLRLRPKLGRTK